MTRLAFLWLIGGLFIFWAGLLLGLLIGQWQRYARMGRDESIGKDAVRAERKQQLAADQESVRRQIASQRHELDQAARVRKADPIFVEDPTRPGIAIPEAEAERIKAALDPEWKQRANADFQRRRELERMVRFGERR